MVVDLGELDFAPPGGWPDWVAHAPYVGRAHPQASDRTPLESGANCQRYAYAVLALFGRRVPPHRSSELWDEPALTHVERPHAARLDLALFNATDGSWGAHVAIVLDERLLHLCAEVGTPAIWTWADFARRERYATLVGVVRVP